MSYQELLNSYMKNPRDVHTVPSGKRKSLWFHVIVKGDLLYVGPSETKTPSCSISSWRCLEKEKFDIMVGFYKRRKLGEKVSAEVIKITRNQVYWYGIFNDLGL